MALSHSGTGAHLNLSWKGTARHEGATQQASPSLQKERKKSMLCTLKMTEAHMHTTAPGERQRRSQHSRHRHMLSALHSWKIDRDDEDVRHAQSDACLLSR
eukprot:1158867-Pelagomonas_calceolata.AAC.13